MTFAGVSRLGCSRLDLQLLSFEDIGYVLICMYAHNY